MSGERLQISKQDRDDSTVLALRGELDLATVDAIREAFDRALSEGAETVVIDLAELSFIDSTGLGAFVDFHQRAEEQGVKVRLEQVPDHVNRLLEITKLNELLDIG